MRRGRWRRRWRWRDVWPENMTRIERSERRRRRREIGEERETREKMGRMERVGPEIDLVERRREGSTLEEVRDILSLPVEHRSIRVETSTVAGAELRQSSAPRPCERRLGITCRCRKKVVPSFDWATPEEAGQALPTTRRREAEIGDILPAPVHREGM